MKVTEAIKKRLSNRADEHFRWQKYVRNLPTTWTIAEKMIELMARLMIEDESQIETGASFRRDVCVCVCVCVYNISKRTQNRAIINQPFSSARGEYDKSSESIPTIEASRSRMINASVAVITASS